MLALLLSLSLAPAVADEENCAGPGADGKDDCCAPKEAAGKDPWAGVDGIDLAHVSNGEVIDLPKVLAPGKFTIVDFGASWCGPCYTAADTIEAYVRKNPDVAVRAVLLAGADAKASFAQPVVKQHLQFAQGLPYFLVFGPDGRSVYKGSELDALFSAIDRKRK